MSLGRSHIISHLVYTILAGVMVLSAIPSPVLSVENTSQGSEHVMHITSIQMPQSEQTVYPGMVIHPIITIHTSPNQKDAKMQVVFSATIGQYELIQNNTYLNVSDGENSTYRISYMIPYIHPGIYHLTITGQGKIAGEDTIIWHEQKRLQKTIEVVLPKPNKGAKMCNCR